SWSCRAPAPSTLPPARPAPTMPPHYWPSTAAAASRSSTAGPAASTSSWTSTATLSSSSTDSPESPETVTHGEGRVFFQGGKALGRGGRGLSRLGKGLSPVGIATNRVGEASPNSGLRPNEQGLRQIEWGKRCPTRDCVQTSGEGFAQLGRASSPLGQPPPPLGIPSRRPSARSERLREGEARGPRRLRQAAQQAADQSQGIAHVDDLKLVAGETSTGDGGGQPGSTAGAAENGRQGRDIGEAHGVVRPHDVQRAGNVLR